MSNSAEQLELFTEAGYLGPARVIEYEKDEKFVRILLSCASNSKGGRQVTAHLALPYFYEPHWGDTVLAAGNEETFYVIGLLAGHKPLTADARELRLQGGACARVAEFQGEDRLQVFSKAGGLIFEHDAATGKSRVDVPDGDLEFAAPNGNINFVSSEEIRFKSRQKVAMNSPDIDIDANRAHINITETHVTGQKFSGSIDNIRLMIDRMETVVNTVIEKAQNSYRFVEGLSQLRTGRLRTLVKATFQFKSKKAFMKAEDDFKIKGEKIHLG